MNVVLDAAEEITSHPMAVFWAEGGLPESFSLPALTPAVVIFSSRYLELVGQLRGISTDETLDEELLAEVSERISLRILSELVLRYGNPALATYLLMKSLIDEHIYFIPPSLEVIENTPRNEMYMAVWFYALLHELGHVYTDHHDRAATDHNDAYLDGIIDSVLAESLGEGLYEKARRENTRNGYKLSLSREVLIPELDADLFSVQLLYETTIRVMRIDGNLEQFRSDRLALEILTMFQLFHYMNSCALAARYATHVGSRPGMDPWGNIANGVRLNVIIDFLARYLATGGNFDPPFDEPKIGKLREKLIEWVNGKQSRASSFDRGHARAIEECFFLNQRDENLAGRLAEYVQSAEDTSFFRIEVDRFCRLAQSLAVRNPDIDLLAAFAQEPAKAMSILRENQLIFNVPWVDGDGTNVPFGLPVGGMYVVFVFVSNSTFDYFVDESRDLVRPGFRMTKTAVISPTQHNVSLAIHRALPEEVEKYTEVVFEGSAAFTRWFQELRNDTLLPDH